MPGLSHALVPAQESKRWSFGHLLLLPVIQKGLFLGPKKTRKIRHANTGLPSIHMNNLFKYSFLETLYTNIYIYIRSIYIGISNETFLI